MSLSDKKNRQMRINKKNTNKLSDISYLDLVQAAASSVGRVVHDTYSWQGTGFMISDRLFMTNKHIIFDPIGAKDFFVEFNYELNDMKIPKSITAFALSPETLFVSSPDYYLDFSIVAIGTRICGEGDLVDFGYSPISNKDMPTKPEGANIIHHPRGGYKQITKLQNQIVAVGPDVLHYYADTDVGSSGAPVFNDNWDLIALHHWGAPTRTAYAPNGEPGPNDTKEGVRISAIVEKINQEKDRMNQKQIALIEKALSCDHTHLNLLKD
jgi:endonuclease G, mitochondrial